MSRPDSARSRAAWSSSGRDNDAFQASTFGSRASFTSTAWNEQDPNDLHLIPEYDGGKNTLNAGFDNGPSGMESEAYLPDSSGKSQKVRQEEEIGEGCWWKFTNGIKSMWSTRHTVDTDEDKDLYIKTTLRELVIYLLFLAILCALTFGMTSSTMFYYTKVMSELFLDSPFPETKNTFRGINHPFDFWRFAEGPLMDGLYWETWYNSRNLTEDEKGYIYYESKLLGVPRLRQLRVKNNTCRMDPKFENEVNGCFGEYSTWNEFKGQFGTGNENVTAWNFQTSEEIDGSTHPGSLALYSGGGFTQNLGTKRSQSLVTIADLKSKLWIDRGTRAVFTDFTVYNANINLFCVIRFLIEFPATGGAIPTSAFRTVKLIRYVTVMDYVIMACECIFVLFCIYYTVEEMIEIREHKLKYFTEFWNILDVFVLVVSYVCIAFSVYRTVKVNVMLDELLKNPEEYADFEYLAFWQSQFNNAVAVAVFFAWIKIFKYISFNKTMTQLSATLSRCSKDMFGFMVMFTIMFGSFAQLGNQMFGSQIFDFSTMYNAVFTLFRIILGDFDFNALKNAHYIFGPVYFFLYVFFIFFVLLNMFLAIINDSYTEVKGDDTLQNDFEVGEYFKKGYDKMMDKLSFKKDKLNDIQLTLAGADANNDNHLEFSEWRNDLKKKGYADTEIEAMFAKYDTDGDRILDPEEQRHLAEDLLKQKDSLNAEYAKMQEQKEGGETPASLADLMDSDDEDTKKRTLVDDGVPYEEYAVLARRVDRMEHSIGSIVSKIDAVLIKLDTMEKAKTRRRETMSKLLDSIIEGGGDELTDEERKNQMESLVAEELARWDEDTMNSSHSDLGTAHGRPMSGQSLRSRPSTGMSKNRDMV